MANPPFYSTRAQHLLATLRQRRIPIGKHDMRPYWRGCAFERYAGEPMTIRRSRALEAVLSRMSLLIREDDLIVGTPAGIAQGQLPPDIDEVTWQRYKVLNESIGERWFTTNFDHLAPDYHKLVTSGLPGLLAEAQASEQAQRDPAGKVFLRSVQIALQAVIDFVRRWEQACVAEQDRASDIRRDELSLIASDLRAIANQAPQTFSQAVQLVWLVHVVLAVEGRGAMAFGRMDQYLWPLYQQELEHDGGQRARAVLECLWAKLEEPFIPNPVLNIAIGGQSPEGEDAVNELSYLILDVTKTMATPNSNVSARFAHFTPDRFYDACVDVIKTGIGFPAVFNDEVLVPSICGLLGAELADARDYCFVGCIETFMPGKMPPWSDSRANLLLALERVFYNGADRPDGECHGIETGPVERLSTFAEFMVAYHKQLAHIISLHCKELAQIKASLCAEDYTSPLLSALTDDCLKRGLDINMGGARYPDMHGIGGMGLGSTADSLAAIKWFIYDRDELSWQELLAALEADYVGFEALRQRLVNEAPKYGNDVPFVDSIAAEIVRMYTGEVLQHRTPGGGRFVPLMAANTGNIWAGREMGATPDGRRAQEPLSDAASPTFGRDHKGPTAVIDSLTRVDYHPVVGGTVVNMKFAPSTLAGDEGTAVWRSLVKTYFKQGGMQLQFNVTGRKVLEAARREPEKYADLVVRVSGFSAMYVSLPAAVQEDILARTEH
ncbi:MAG: pyruvate formate lyase family protein [Anaerolineae bacterium]